MLNRRKIAISSISCAAAVLTLSVAPAPAVAKTTVIGQATKHTDGSLFDIASATSRWVKYPKPGSLRVLITAVPDDPTDSNQITISGGMSCPGKGGGAHEIGVGVEHVPAPFATKVPFPFKAKNPKRCRVNVAYVNFDPDPPDPNPFAGVPPGTITITITWKH
jgi:hypothetical protein